MKIWIIEVRKVFSFTYEMLVQPSAGLSLLVYLSAKYRQVYLVSWGRWGPQGKIQQSYTRRAEG